jgi:hypothetical protein
LASIDLGAVIHDDRPMGSDGLIAPFVAKADADPRREAVRAFGPPR